MLIASAARSLIFHDYPKGNVTHVYEPESLEDGPIKSISWSKDGNWLALVPDNGYAEIISVKDQLKLIHSVQDVEEPTCASFENMTKKHLGIGTKNGLVLIYDIKARHVKKRFPRGTSVVTHVQFTAKDSHVVAACKNGEVLLYSNTTNNLSGTFRIPRSKFVTAIRTNYMKRHLILGGSNEGVIVVWDTNASKCKYSFDGHNAPVTCLAFSPINSDLIISTGLDRQFLLHDIDSTKCIARINVDNSLTSADFSPDGMFFIVGCQNGKILVYDTRNIQQPINTIQSHTNEGIKHLYFQYARYDSGNSVNAPTEFSLDTSKPSSSVENISVEKNDSFEKFMVQSYQELQNKTDDNGNDGADSFIDALGLGKNPYESTKQEENILFLSTTAKKLLECNRTNVDSPTKNSTKLIHDRYGLGDSKKMSCSSVSAPEPAHVFSPVVSNTQMKYTSTPNQNLPGKSVRLIAKEVFHEELQSSIQEVKQEMTYQMMSTASQIKRMCLDLQMSMIKEFMKLEKQYNSLKEGINNSSSLRYDSMLFEENMFLKLKIAQLEEQVASLTTDSSSKMS